MTIEFKLPELGEGVDSADVSRIFVEEGDEIEADQNVLELETEKAVADLPCPHAGKITAIHVSAGDTIQVGQKILSIDEGEEESSAPAEPADEEENADESSASEVDQGAEVAGEKKTGSQSTKTKMKPTADENKGDHIPPPAGPATRRLARKLEVDISALQPDDGERIKPEDVVRAYVERGNATSLADEDLPDFEQFGTVERESLNKIARTTAKRLAMSWRLVPQVTQHGLADITELEAARRQFIHDANETQAKLTLTAIAVKAVVGALRQFPRFNASLDFAKGELVLKHFFHIGIAVDTDHGLLVPVIRDADRKSILELAADIEELAGKARTRHLKQDELQGASFTISNQGGIGGGHFTPLVNWPEVAILGIGRARSQLEMHANQPRERLKLPLSLSYDPRAIMGADAARFVSLLEDSLAGTFELLVAS